MDVREWEKRRSDLALYETNRELESHRLELNPSNTGADQAQRERISLHGELELRNRCFQESRARNCQEIVEIRRFCSLDAEKARQSRIEELSKNQERRPSVVDHLMSEIQELQNKGNSLTDDREFNEFERSSSSGASHVPTRPLTIPSRSEKPSREPTMPNDTRNAMGISGNVFESLPAREGQSIPRFENSRNLA